MGSAPAANDAADRIAAINTRVGGRIGVAALDTGTGQHIEYKANERFPMCSTFKVLAAAAVLKLVDEGKEYLDRMVPYAKEDILEYAPVTKEHLKEGRMTLGDLFAAAVEQNDNTAGNLLLRTIGGPSGLTSFLRTIGDKTTRLDRMEPDLNTAIPGDERDTTTPAAMREDLERLLTKDVLSPTSRRQLETWLAGKQNRRTNDSRRCSDQLACRGQKRPGRQRSDQRCCDSPSTEQTANLSCHLLRRFDNGC